MLDGKRFHSNDEDGDDDTTFSVWDPPFFTMIDPLLYILFYFLLFFGIVSNCKHV